ncbi:DUF4013 domain-containing protein [Methanobrevibacter sp.]|uniref:DUF4013 domain-containing protein n=1 Tax=Methanobrevibacter sp. TaxID=66852 RepID=UPI003890A736
MDLKEIVADAFKYPFGDKEQFLMISAVYALLGIILSAGIISAPFYNGAFRVISYLAFSITFLYLSGYQVDIIRISCELKDHIPRFNPRKNIKDSLRLLVLSLVFSVIIGVLYFIGLLSFILLLRSGEIVGFVLAIIVYIILLIALLLVIWLIFMSICRLAYFGFNESLEIRESFNDLKKIGFGKIFVYMILVYIVVGIISSAGLLLSLGIFELVETSPGLVIAIAVYFAIQSYVFVFQSRAMGLLYTNAIYDI